MSGGKGSRPRPISVSQSEYDARWDHIFSRDLQKEEPDSTNKESIVETNKEDKEDK